MCQQVPELAAEAFERAAGDPERLVQIERALIGCDYASVGGALTAAWRLPDCFRIAITWQNAPEKAESHVLEATILHVAGRLAEQYLACTDAAPVVASLDPLMLSSIGLARDQFACVDEEARASSVALEYLLVAGGHEK